MGGPDANWIFYYDRVNGNWAPVTLGPHPVPKAILNDPSLRTPLVSNNDSQIPLVYDPVTLGHQDSLVISTAIRALQLYKPRGQLLNLAEPDTAGHWVPDKGWYHAERRLYLSFDKDLGRLIAAYKAAGIYDQTLFVITADHGMTHYYHRVLDRASVQNQIDSMLGSNSTILFNGGGKGGPSMASIWLKNPANNARVAKALFAHHYDNVSAIYYLTNSNGHYQYKMAGCEGDTSLPSQTCSPPLEATYNYLMSTDAGTTGEDIAILFRENAANSELPIMFGRHGGADWASQHVTLIVSGPGVQPGTSDHPARLTDIAPTIERFMGITPQARDGLVLADAFQQPNQADLTAQNTSDQTLNVYVNALMQRAQMDLKMEAAGKIPNYIPPDERPPIHWKQRIAITIVGSVVVILLGFGLAWVIAEVRRQGTGLTWVE
jgi:hypothetical protein